MRSLLARSKFLQRIYRAISYRIAVRRMKGPKLLRRFAALYPEAFFIQVGANDGDQLDPLREQVLTNAWRGIMVEPVPYVFDRLQANNGHLSDRIVLENVAVADVCGHLPFWHLQKADDSASVPRLYDALGSFRRDVVLKHVNFIPDIEERLVCTEVPSVTFDVLCERNGVGQIDILQIDTEGYDFEIIRRIDFSRYAPRLLIYEHHHFDPQTKTQCETFLRDQGYVFFHEGMDTWCLHTRLNDDRGCHMYDYWQRLLAREGSVTEVFW